MIWNVMLTPVQYAYKTIDNGFITNLDGNLISWKSQRQPTEAKYVSLAAIIHEAIWLKRKLSPLYVYPKAKVVIFEDNQRAIALAKNLVFQRRTKHIDIKYHFDATK
jgi:hypothetical protein